MSQGTKRKDDRFAPLEATSFIFGHPVANLETFCNTLFSCDEPFWLWGAPVRVNDKLYRVQALDLSDDATLRFEIYRKFMRVYAPAGSDEDALSRLYDNLKKHCDPEIKKGISHEECQEYKTSN